MPKFQNGPSDADDPFMQGTSFADDASDPFLLDEVPDQARRNLLPSSHLQIVLQFADERSLVAAAQVNRTWNEEANADAVWKRLCKNKFGADLLKESKKDARALGWKLCFFAGLCKHVLVNTPDKQAIVLVPYPGLTLRDLLVTVGTEPVSHHTITSQSFSEAFDTMLSDVNVIRGIGSRVAAARLCDVLVEPFSTLYLERVPDRATPIPSSPTQRRESEDHPLIPLDEQRVKEQWKVLARAAVAKYPRFVQRWLGDHDPSLGLGTRRSSLTRPADVPHAPVPSRSPVSAPKTPAKPAVAPRAAPTAKR